MHLPSPVPSARILILLPHLTSCAAVGQDTAGTHVLAAAEDLDALHLDSQVLDAGSHCEEATVEQEEGVDGLVYSGCAKLLALAEWVLCGNTPICLRWCTIYCLVMNLVWCLLMPWALSWLIL